MADRPTKEEKMEGTLKEMLVFVQTEKAKYEDKDLIPSHLIWELHDDLKRALGHDHYGTIGWGHHFVLKCWLVIEIWKDGRVIPRCISLTEPRAEYVKDMLIDRYEKLEPRKRPRISVEHQRMEHIFGFEMERGRLGKTSDTFSPSRTNVFELEERGKNNENS